MFLTDIFAAVCSGATLAYALVHINFLMRLASGITSREKQIVFITMIVVLSILIVKLILTLGKIFFRLYHRKQPEGFTGGFFTKMYVMSAGRGYRRLAVGLSIAVTFYVFAMFLLVYPFKRYTIGAGRTIQEMNQEVHQLWELTWFLPMLQFFIIMFAVALVINVTRLKIVNVKKEYQEIYAVSQSRGVFTVRCNACNFDNHISSTHCGKCEESLRITAKAGMNPAGQESL